MKDFASQLFLELAIVSALFIMKLTDDNITAFDIEIDYSLYHSMIDIMTKVDGVAPIGSCCGRNKRQHCEEYIANKSKYLNTMAIIEQRTITPKTNGKLIYVSGEAKHYNLDLCSDKDIMHLIEIGAVQKEDFNFPKVEEKVVEKKAKAKK